MSEEKEVGKPSWYDLQIIESKKNTVYYSFMALIVVFCMLFLIACSVLAKDKLTTQQAGVLSAIVAGGCGLVGAFFVLLSRNDGV